MNSPIRCWRDRVNRSPRQPHLGIDERRKLQNRARRQAPPVPRTKKTAHARSRRLDRPLSDRGRTLVPMRWGTKLHASCAIKPASVAEVSGWTVRDHILCVDDDETVLQSLRWQLAARSADFCVVDSARTVDEAMASQNAIAGQGDRLSVVLLGDTVAGQSGLDLLQRLRRVQPQVAGVLLLPPGGSPPPEAAMQQAGVALYVHKPLQAAQLHLTANLILQVVRLQRANESLLDSLQQKRSDLETLQQQMEMRIRERTQALEDANRRLAELAVTDGLTGLYNHRYLQDHLVLEVERSLRTGIPLGMLMIDVDHFRLYNNRFGHQTGDEVLRRVARLIAEHRRVNDVVARYGGEEFALLLINADHRVARRLAERLRLRVQAEPFPATRDIPGGHLTISVGVASCPADGNTASSLIAAADAALFRAKNAGRNLVCVAGEPTQCDRPESLDPSEPGISPPAEIREAR